MEEHVNVKSSWLSRIKLGHYVAISTLLFGVDLASEVGPHQLQTSR